MANATRPKIGKEILYRLRQGEETAFDAVYWKYSAWVYNFIHSVLSDKLLAEDLTQTVFLKIWEYHEEIDPENSFESYIFTICRRLIYKETENQLQNERLAEGIQRQQLLYDSQLEEQIETQSLQDYIFALVEELPPARREIYKLSRIKNLSNKEIAAQLAISEKTVETQIYRSLQFLKQKLSEDKGLFILLSCLFLDISK